MIRFTFALLVALLPLAARAQTEPQTLVDRATLAVQEMLSGDDGAQARGMMQRARGVLICPRVFKAGFFLGGEGGDCVLVGRSGGVPQASTSPQLVVPLAGGTWSGPAFYGMGGGSFGFQIGIQDSEVIFIVLTDNGLQALMNSQFKFGGDASVAFATVGGGVKGDTTTALRADIVAFADSARPVRRRLAGRRADQPAQRLEPELLWPGIRRPADRAEHAGAEPGRRAAEGNAGPLHQRVAATPRSRYAAGPCRSKSRSGRPRRCPR